MKVTAYTILVWLTCIILAVIRVFNGEDESAFLAASLVISVLHVMYTNRA